MIIDPPTNSIEQIRDWFETAKPNESLSVRDVQVQTGVHFEEVHEMLQEISGLTPQTDVLLANAKLAMHALAEHFKNEQEVIFLVEEGNHIRYLDALCDQIVTATGTAHYMQYMIVPAVDEVARSNESKFINDPETGKRVCVKDANGKIAKGPDYFKADLSKYV